MPGPARRAAFAFAEVSRRAGLDFIHLNGVRRPVDILQTTAPGLAWLDYDRDGYPDLFCVNSAPPDPQPGVERGHRLYRNRGDGTFEDVTDRAGLRGRGEDGQGAAVGDYDGDGWTDLYVTCFGPNHLYRNMGDGRFKDVGRSAGTAGDAPGRTGTKWSTAAAWFDADGDGDLDLYVTNYCRLGGRLPRLCDYDGVRSTCAPVVYPGQADLFFRNQGGGRFTADDGTFALAGRPQGRGLGVLPWDADEDGRPDLFVANDGQGNFFFHNRGDRYEETAYACGLALDATGGDPASMGLDVDDYDGNGRPDLAVGNYQDVPNILYEQKRPLAFQDVSTITGMALLTRSVLTFGTGFADFNLDGHRELLFVNGHVQDNVALLKAGVSYEQKPQLLEYGARGFQDASALAGPVFQRPIAGRGAAFADYDRDGDEDVAVAVNGGPVQLWRNDSPRGHWLQVELRGKSPNREAIGARLELQSDGRSQVRQVLTGRSYLSDSERTVTFGLGTAARVDMLEVRWPGGVRRTIPVAGVDRRVVVEE
jgi:enediyne biosynthesis protein E4